MRKSRILAFCVAVVLGSLPVIAAPINPEEAAAHVGETTTVCGVVASTRYASRSRGQPTLLNLGKSYPAQVFTALIWRTERTKFGEPEKTLQGKRICVTGTVHLYRNVPEVILTDPSQIAE